MADSNITKNALATALKNLMNEKPFEKISVGDICEQCNMNRKSFYYHFQDKYDLVNWIFDTEFIAHAKKMNYSDSLAFFSDISRFFYKNQAFYRKALLIKGQNSFSDHFREFLIPIIESRLDGILDAPNISEFQLNFFTDAYIMTLQRWILEYNNLTPDEFLEQIKICFRCLAVRYDKLS